MRPRFRRLADRGHEGLDFKVENAGNGSVYHRMAMLDGKQFVRDLWLDQVEPYHRSPEQILGFATRHFFRSLLKACVFGTTGFSAFSIAVPLWRFLYSTND